MAKLTLAMAGRSDPGRLRQQNEDYIAVLPELGLAVLADGMGGHKAGEVASRLTTDVTVRHCAQAMASDPAGLDTGAGMDILRNALEVANKAVFDLAQNCTDCSGMGSTVVAALFQGETLCVAHVGDSRLYRLRNNQLDRLTEDHSVVQEMINRGLVTPEQARQSVSRNLITRALGIDTTVAVDLRWLPTQPGDIYLLCSDGLNDTLTDSQIGKIVSACGDDLEAAGRQLVEAANVAGGPDNISVVLARVNGAFERAPDAASEVLRANKHNFSI